MKKIMVITAAALLTVSGFASADNRVRDGGYSQQKDGGSKAGAAAGASSTLIQEASSGIHYSGEYKMKNVPAVSAPGLTTTLTETCMGSSSGGVAVAGFGATFGTTWRDSACVRRLDSRELLSIGYPLGAKERMCDDAKNRAALLRAGTPCRADIEELPPVAAPAPAPVVEEAPALGQVDHNLDWMNIDG